MPGRKTITTFLHLCGAAGTAAIALAAAHAVAQSTEVEQLTVVAKPAKGHPETASYSVSYSDLDLQTKEGRKQLADRIKIVAAYVCKKVDQPNSTCRVAAANDALAEARHAEHNKHRHGAHHTAGPAWVPPPAG